MPVQFNAAPLTLLLLAVLFAGACAYFWWFHRRSITDMSPARKRWALGIRLFIVALLFLALAGTRFVRRNDTLSVIFLMDVSKSVRDDQRELELRYVRDAVATKRPTDTVGVVTFGQDPDPVIAPDPGMPFKLDAVRHSGPTNATNIAQAMEAALSLPPRGSAARVVVLSDGNENVGSALAEVPTLTARGVKVDSVVLPSSLKKEALIEKTVVPARVKIGEPFSVKVVTNALNAQHARLTLRRDGQPVASARDVELPAGKRIFSFDTHIDKPGFYRFEAELETDPAADTVIENNKGLGFVSVRGKPQVLYIAETPSLVPFLQRALKEQNIDVVYLPPAACPSSAAAFQPFDSVILSDVPRTEFSDAQMQAMQVSTRDFGVGFGMLGGQNSFGAGGYRLTPIEETLPVSLEVKKQKRIPSVAVALVIEDLEIPSSVNMSKEAAKALVELLDPMDEVGVLDCNGFGGFGNMPIGGGASGTWRIALQHVVDRAAIQSQIDTLENMGDPPSYDPYLMEAARKLQASDAKIKHIVFLGDGDAIWEGSTSGSTATLRKINDMGITVSTVATGADQNGIAFMAAMARDGGGRSYVADQPNDLPRILLKDQQTISAPPIVEEPFTPKEVPGDDVLQGLGAMPPLLGYNIGTAKATAGVSLISHRNDPILATWRYGLGRSMAFMSDDKNKWAVQWLPWSGYGQFWAEAVRWTMRSFTPSDFQTLVTMEGTRGHVQVTAIDKDGRFVNRLNFDARVVGPDADSSKPADTVPLRQTAPGTYEATFDAAKIGTYLVNVTRNVPGKPPQMTVTGLVVPYSPEYRDLTANDFLMTQLAQAGGGVEETNPAQAFGGNRPTVYSAVDLTQGLLLVAMLLFPVDVGVRRLALDRSDFGRALSWARAHLSRAPRPIRTAAATPELGSLMTAKQRARLGVESRESRVESAGTTGVGPGLAPSAAGLAASAEPASAAPKPEALGATARSDDGRRVTDGVHAPAAAPPASPTVPHPANSRLSTLDSRLPAEAPEFVLEEPQEAASGSGMSRLMAAKRRAREQQEKDRSEG